MAQDIIITPRSGEPRISFTGSGTTASSINLNVLSDSTLSFEGTQGQLFSITNNLTSGVIFGVNDIGGLPLIEASANGNVSLVRYGNNVGIGTGSPSAKLDILETWNTSAVQTGIKLNVIDVSSNANSNLIELQNSGQTRFSFRKDGNLIVISGTSQTPILKLQGSDRFAEIAPYSFGAGGIQIRGLNVFSPNDSEGGTIFMCNRTGTTSNGLYHENVNDVLALRRSTNPNTLRIYNTFTDFSNYERASFGWNASAFEIETEASGTGLARNLIIGTSGVPRIFVSSTGQIGIGTTNPTQTLHLSGGAPTIHLTNTFGDTLRLQNTGGGRSGAVGMGTSIHSYGGAWINSFVETYQDFYTLTSVGSMRLQNRSLMVGNNLTPSATLHVSGNALITSSVSALFINADNGSNTSVAIGGSRRDSGLYFANNGYDLIYNRAGSPMALFTFSEIKQGFEGSYSWTTGSLLNAADTSLKRYAAGVVSATSAIITTNISAVNYYNSSGALPTTISTLYDVSGSVIPAEGYILIYTSGKWVAMPPTIDGGSASG